MQNNKISHEKKIGIIGVGFMGGFFAGKFIKKGYKVYICDIDEKKCKEFVKKGAVMCSSAEEVAQKADLIFEITPNDSTSREVWLGQKGILKSATPDKILIVSSTISAAWVDELAECCEKARLIFFDMAINGGDRGLTLLCGGDKKILMEIKPILRAVASKIWYFGLTGQGMRYKLILNFLQAIHIVSFGQALKIAKVQKMDIKKVGNALVSRPGGAAIERVWELYQDMPDGVAFKIELIVKDLFYTKKLSKNLDVNLLDAVLNSYKQAIEKGFAKKDWTSIVTMKD